MHERRIVTGSERTHVYITKVVALLLEQVNYGGLHDELRSHTLSLRKHCDSVCRCRPGTDAHVAAKRPVGQAEHERQVGVTAAGSGPRGAGISRGSRK